MLSRIATALTIAAVIASAGCVDAPARSMPPASAPTQEEALLWNSVYPNLTLRPYYVEGHEPSQIALDALHQAASEVTGKNQVVVEPPVLLTGMKPDSDRTWTVHDLQRFHQERFDASLHPLGSGDTAILAVFYLDGRYEAGGSETGAGVQAGHELYIFTDAYGGDLHAPLPAPERVERAVLIHEFGHALGLVNCGIPMTTDHQDPDSPCHSANPNSVMGSRNDVEPTLDLLDEGAYLPYTFDADDLQDIRTFQANDPGPVHTSESP